MHRPPAAAWKAGVTPLQSRLTVALAALALLVSIGFGSSQGWRGSSLLLVLVWLVCCAVAVWGLRRCVHGQLRWDGEHWHWSGVSDCAVVQIQCVLDLQRLLLLRMRCEQGKGSWLWLECGTPDSGGWLALRRAVVASQAAESPAQSGSLPW